jgi:hypothetical protein
LEDARSDVPGLIEDQDVVIYNGHAGYGALDALDDPDHFRSDKYQIFMLNACSSYSYYVRSIFEGKATASDPDGWDNADVISNLRATRFTKMQPTTEIVLDKLIEGFEMVLDGSTREPPSWQRIVGSLSHYTETACRENANPRECRPLSYTDSQAEIYGVSGIATNRYQPPRP